jgi:phosphoenolpyruvate-protein phosphotransferase (PTS system enzyme I)
MTDQISARPVLSGTPVVPGVGWGPVIRPAPAPVLPSEDPAATLDVEQEVARFDDAASAVAKRLEDRVAAATGAAAEVLAATAALARDRGLRALVEKHVRSGGSAAHATMAAVDELAVMFQAAGGLMAERVTDLRDIAARIVAELTSQPEPGIPVPTEPSVLLATDLAPADTAGLDPAFVLAIATTLGGPTSHTAIIARQLGIPCVVAVPGLDEVLIGETVLVDGTKGEVRIAPDAADARARSEEARAVQQAAAAWVGPGRTADGHAVEVLANVQDATGAAVAAGHPVEGVGLFRTELCFLDRESEPSVGEQADIYGRVFEQFAERKVVVRTLDAGSDKPLAFTTQHDESNPALGVRGLRVGFEHPEMLDRQLDAIAQAAEAQSARVWVMAPMVATVSEAVWFAGRVRSRGLSPGAMIEVPSAALHVDRLLRHLDFVSIGTNDLSQYTMAADRMSSALSVLTDPWQPAVLALVAMVARSGRMLGKPVGVCGEAAADPLLACVLAGLGVTSLSAAAPATAAVGAKLGSVELAACESAAEAVLAADDPGAARDAARSIIG